MGIDKGAHGGLQSGRYEQAWKPGTERLIDYRDRVSVMIWVVLMGLVAQRFLQFPTRVLDETLLGSPVTLMITANTLLGALLAALVATGTEAVVRAHPRIQLAGLALRDRFSASALALNSGQQLSSAAGQQWRGDRFGLGGHWVFWALPIALIVVVILLLPVAPTGAYWLAGLVLTGLALGASMAGLYFTIDPFARGYRRARLGLNALTYAIALLLFLVVYRTRVRSLVSATEITLVSSLLALELLRGSERPLALVGLYAGITGLILGQATWALNYWRLDSLTGGLVLLLLFYNVVGLAQNAIQGPIRRRVLIEHVLLTILGLALIWEFAP
jgi:hypothetical protein